jgi:hypothetical protein
MSADEASANRRRRWLRIPWTIVQRSRDCIRKTSYTHWIGTAAAAGVLLVAGMLFFIARAYWDQEQTDRLKRTFEIIAAVESSVNEEEMRGLVREFPGRWQKNVRFCVGKEESESFLEVALKPDDSAKYRRWNLARKHLNGIEPLAFAYYYGLGDRRILTASSCGYLTRSSRYFGHLINVFGAYFGGGQPWQVIPKSARLMEDEWGPACIKLPGEQARVERPYYRLPAEATEPVVGERMCVGGPAFPDAK